MTPEETREHVQRRLSELGWNVHIGRAGYEKIFRATGGAEKEANRICHKLVSVGSAGESREITDATVEMAVTDAMRHEESPPRRRANGSEEADRAAIERLGAILEERLKVQGQRPQPVPPPRPGAPAPSSAAGEEARPTALVVHSSDKARARAAEALGRDFRVLQAADGERAWNALLEQPDVAVVVVERPFAEANGHSLTRRMRENGEARGLGAIPIVVLGAGNDDAARANALAGVVSVPGDADPRELRTRVLASYKAHRAPASGPRHSAREQDTRRPPDVLFADTRYANSSSRERSGRFASTLAITISATALLVLALLATFYVSRNPDALGLRASESAEGRAEIAAPPAESETAAPEEAERETAPSETARAEAPPAAAAPAAPKIPESERSRDTTAAATTEENAANGPRAPPSVAAADAASPATSETGETAPAADPPLPSLARAPESDAALPETPAGTGTPTDAGEGAGSAPGDRPLWERLEQQAPAAGAGAAGGVEDGADPDAAAGPGQEAESAPSNADSTDAGSTDTDSTPAESAQVDSPATSAPDPAPRNSPPAASRRFEAGNSAEATTSAPGAGARGEETVAEETVKEPAREEPVPIDPPPAVAESAPETSEAPARTESAPATAPEEQRGQPSGEASRSRAQPEVPTQPRQGPPAARAPAVTPPASGEPRRPATAESTPPPANQAPATTGASPAREEPASAETAPPASPPEAEPAPPPAEPEQRTQLATARPPRSAASPQPEPAQQISRDELVSLVERFASVYEAGDLEQFLGMFADNARTNDRTGRDGIRKDYQALFSSTDLREMNLGQLSWEVNGNQAYGWGEFDVTVRRQNDREQFTYTGSLTFVVEKVNGRLRIVRLFHGQQRVGS